MWKSLENTVIGILLSYVFELMNWDCRVCCGSDLYTGVSPVYCV